MRIIGGKYRGRKIKMPKGVKIRPTQDRVREAIFNIIRTRVHDSAVLDLYAGSGAFGIEALSHGAKLSIFVDNNINCIKTIKRNLTDLRGPEVVGLGGAQVLKMDGIRAIDRFEKEDAKLDIIFLDPPYYRDLARNCLIKIGACDILSPQGFVICEHHRKDTMPKKTDSLFLFKEKKYGDTLVSFYRRGR